MKGCFAPVKLYTMDLIDLLVELAIWIVEVLIFIKMNSNILGGNTLQN